MVTLARPQSGHGLQASFEAAQERFLAATDAALAAGERHFEDVSDEAAAAAYAEALAREREAARELERLFGAFFRSRRA